jgi:hypothetical protein
MQYVGWRKMRKMLQGYRTSNRPDLPADVNVRGGGVLNRVQWGV